MAGGASGHRIPVGWAVAVVAAVLAFVNVGAGTWRRFRVPGWLKGPHLEGVSAWASLIPPPGWTPERTGWWRRA
jgi:hypothetical protein